MNTHPSESLLALYAGGELDTPERSGVETHLETCGECRSKIAEIENVRQLLSSAFTELTHDDLQLVRNAVSDQVENSRRGRRVWALEHCGGGSGRNRDDLRAAAQSNATRDSPKAADGSAAICSAPIAPVL